MPPTELDRPPRARRSRRLPVLELLVVLAAVGVAAGFTALVWSSHPDRGRPLSPVVPQPPAAAPGDLGHKVFLRDCAWCHGVQGEGTPRGPSLKTSGPAMADFQLSTGRMPLGHPGDRPERGKPSYSRTTIDALVQYVGTLGTGEPVPALAAGDPVKGEELFVTHCAACHSSSGTGVIVTDGDVAPALFPTADRQVAEAVRTGPGQMPPFGPGEIDDSELADVVSYVHELGSPQVKGGNSLDQYGPIAEGIFLFALPLPLLVLVIRLLGKKAPR